MYFTICAMIFQLKFKIVMITKDCKITLLLTDMQIGHYLLTKNRGRSRFGRKNGQKCSNNLAKIGTV